MSRLIAFGCSNTYGVGLKDCYDAEWGGSKDLPPSKFAWPEKLAEILGVECVNASRGGSSNREIWWKIINFDFQPDDVIAVLWSFPDRDCIINPLYDEHPEQINTWHRNKTVQRFVVDTYCEFDKRMESHTYIHHANILARPKVKNFYNFASQEVQLCPYPEWQQYPILFDMENVYDGGDRALDEIHPGPECHNQLAQEMHKKIQSVEQNQIPNYYPNGIKKITIN